LPWIGSGIVEVSKANKHNIKNMESV